MPTTRTDLDQLCINTIRTLSIDAVQAADSGHPGMPLGAAPMAYVLWKRFLKHDPTDPAWPDRDRFVLSAGHGSMLLYSLLHTFGYDLSLDDLRAFRQWGSRTPGHPELGVTPGVEATTGPLGQGSANAVGMAVAERFLAHRYNRPGHEIFDHWTYALVSDGDLMEGVSAEAASLAGHLGLGKLVYLYDANDVSLDGPTSLAFSTEDVAARYRSYGWHVQHVEHGDTDLAAIDAALRAARAKTEMPSLIVVRTTIGYGSPNKAGSSKAHGAPLGADEVALTKKSLGWEPTTPFTVPEAARTSFREASDRGREAHARWRERKDAWAEQHPDLARELDEALGGRLPRGWDAELPRFEPGGKLATREAGGKVLNAIAAKVPWLIGGDADLSESTKTAIDGAGSFEGRGGSGRNIHFGVREHAMGSIANGMAYHGGTRPYTATFFTFSDYMRPALRLAAMNHLPVVNVFTHDSIGLGEDGPTHQPVEHLMALRVIPNMRVIRPADANETAEAWRMAMERTNGPTALVLSRQKLATLQRPKASSAEHTRRGAYVLADADGGAPEAIAIATGSEVEVALAAREILAREGVRVRVVSMPCWEAFAEQDRSYRDEVLPPSIRARVSVEAGTTLGWERWIGSEGVAVGVDRFGASAPGPRVLDELGINADAVADALRTVIRANG